VALLILGVSLFSVNLAAAYQWDPTISNSNIFYDNFSQDTSLDPSKWLIAAKQWGGDSTVNGGVVPENVSLQGGYLHLVAHGDQFSGTSPLGINKDFSDNNTLGAKRVGAAVATQDYFASGKYEINARIAPVPGVASAFWTFHYEEINVPSTANSSTINPSCPLEGDANDGYYYVPNHEIDIENVWQSSSSVNGRFVSYRCETQPTSHLTNAMPTDGAFHTYTIDWHTNDPNAASTGKSAQRVDFYVDGQLKDSISTNVPTRASRLWLAIWFPNGWAGTPTFNTSALDVASVKITKYNETGNDILDPTTGAVAQEVGDKWYPETYESQGWSNAYHRPQQTTLNSTFGNGLDPSQWLIARKNWGGQFDTTQSYNGGVLPQNVKLQNNDLILEAHGDWYNGLPLGIDKAVKNNPPAVRRDGKRVGAAIATANYYGPGKYSVTMKVANALGLSTAIWTFNYQELYSGQSQPVQPASLAGTSGFPSAYTFQCLPVGCPDSSNPGNGYYAINHEIDVEMPGRTSQHSTDYDFKSALFNTWTGENTTESTIQFAHDVLPPQNDGQFHTYTIDWHTNATDGGPAKRVDFYVDGIKYATSTTNVPTRASRFWIAAWFPNEWAGSANFNIAQAEIKNVQISPYTAEPSDWYHEGLTESAWANNLEYPQLSTNTTTPTPTPAPTPTPTTIPPTNKVTNAGFETSNTILTNWDCSKTGPSASAGVAVGAGVTGNAAKLTPSQTDTAHCEQTVTGLTIGSTYTVSASLKGSATNLPWIYLGVLNGTQSGTNNSSGYQTKSFTFVAQSTTATIYIEAYKQQQGDTFADNVSVTGS
jgi:hypothetical protein